jgi:hypothetical protein
MLTVYNLDPALLGATNLLDQNSPNNKRSFDAWDLSFQSRVRRHRVRRREKWEPADAGHVRCDRSKLHLGHLDAADGWSQKLRRASSAYHAGQCSCRVRIRCPTALQ